MANRLATYHDAGRLPGDLQNLFMFTCWNGDRAYCGCHSVRQSDLQANIEALERKGYTVKRVDVEYDRAAEAVSA